MTIPTRTIASNPWRHLDPPGKEYEWLFNEDSYSKATSDRIISNCSYVAVEEKQPIWSVEDSKEPEGFQDIVLFTSTDGKDFRIAKRIVDQEGKGKWHQYDWFTLKVRGCCNIVEISKE